MRSQVQIPRRANVTLIRQELMEKYGYTREAADDVLFYTADHWRTNGHKASEWKVPDSEGFITVRYHELSRFTVEDHREISGKPLDVARRTRYNRGSKGLPDHPSQERRKGTHMPPAARGRRSATRTAPAPEPEPASQNGDGEVDFQRYIDKDFSPTMADFVTWFEENVGSLDDLPVDKILVLGVQTYSHFQKSEFNVAQRDARRSARAASRPEPEPEPEPEPAPKGRGRGRAAAATPEPAPAPARKGRGRAAARAGAEAPY